MTERRILIADDNRDFANGMATLLRLSGYQTQVADDGVEALRLVTEYKPHALLLDIGMPKMSGHEVCRQIRQTHGDRQPIIIALTGWGQDRDREESREAGFDAHVVKPPDFDRVLSLLETLLLSRGSCVTQNDED
jgi:CheY-like chemotaxis protein